jgi:uncharacterized protein YdhG (YjbR/CyaY superfamily)
MNMFKPVSAKNREEYLAQLAPERKVILEKIEEIILETAPELEPFFSYNMPGYGAFSYIDSKGNKVDWPIIAVASQKNFVSIYVCAVVKGEYVAEKYKATLGKVSVGKSCIRFKKLEDIDLLVLKKVIAEAVKNPGLK